ncbi:MAG: CocE/NonD family hydrolase [Mesorhizobium sp.]|nr:MAG: CocE/NonD family hydrolase [Mesorhizobium sp.]TIO54444.1 MAG: CocE/NonD family hydrolase [Mesorhizobium sp.]TIO59473.1 MAG: CocE/NonD family hydrolase [Mesorhizobium sp.]TJV63945.1 MAG: CocE/NonD family hydrolase [Mesorhizobium sp.]
MRTAPQDVNAALLTGNNAGTSVSTTTGGAQTPEAGVRTGPRQVRDIENIWIPMSDGTKLAARMWLPEDAEENPVPALLDYVPYRKRDVTRFRDETVHPYLASHGYACVRADIRGSGDSEGLPQDESAKQELDDGVEIIAWLASQPWCAGKVGMFGKSWGGGSALQVAARRPPELKAIISICSSDDRYAGGMVYHGGLIHDSAFFEWGVHFPALCARPPDPAIVGDRWREMWMQRLNNLDYYTVNGLIHQHRDAYHKQGSISEDYGAIQCPVYAVGGWLDPWARCAVARMLANLKCPRKGLIGPWAHDYPHAADPGPAIDWLTESLRWWDYWLKDIDTGIMDEPMYRAWMPQELTMRGVHHSPGRWVAEESWPSPRITPLQFHLTKNGLESNAGAETARVLKPLQTVGITAPRFHVRDNDTEAPTDQRIDDARSLTFDSEPLEEEFQILGQPVVTLDLAVDKPVALLSIRLNEIEPDGLSKRITYNVLNLTHRNSDEFPEPMVPGKRYRISMPLQDCAHVFKPGRRIRLAVSTSHWPAYLPSPEPVTLTVYAGRSEFELPVRPPRAEDADLHSFGPAFVPEPTSGRTVLEEAPAPTRTHEWDVEANKLTTRAVMESGRLTVAFKPARRYRIDATGTELSTYSSEVTEILDHDPTSVKIETQYVEAMKRDDWDVRVESRLRLSLTKDNFLFVGQIKAFEDDEEVFTKTWDHTIPRLLV